MVFHLDALKKIYLIANKNHIILVNVFIYTGHGHYAEEEPVYEEILQGFCQSEYIPFLNLRSAFSTYKGGEALFLENDGHFSSRGAQLVAEVLAKYLENGPSKNQYDPVSQKRSSGANRG